VRGHAWNCFSSLSAVACHRSLSDTVLGVVPVHHLIQILTRAEMFCSGNYLRSDTLPYDLTSKNLLAADAAKPTTMYALVIKPDAGRRERRERMHKHEASAYHTSVFKSPDLSRFIALIAQCIPIRTTDPSCTIRNHIVR
jgi:hypothetical protein